MKSQSSEVCPDEQHVHHVEVPTNLSFIWAYTVITEKQKKKKVFK